jgi:hypothetical protein
MERQQVARHVRRTLSELTHLLPILLVSARTLTREIQTAERLAMSRVTYVARPVQLSVHPVKPTQV